MSEIDDRLAPESRKLPGIQIIFLLLVLIVYPALSIVMGMTGNTDPQQVTSKIIQVYLPTLIIQIVMIAALWIVLYRSGADFAEIGFAKSGINWSNVISALIFFVGAWGLMALISVSIERSGFIPRTEFMTLLPSNAIEGLLWGMLSLGAAFSEELIFRGFVITRLRKVTGRFWIAALIGSLAFSMGHLYQGPAGIFLTFLYGMLFAGLFAARGSVFPCIVAHFLQDIIALAAIFVKI